MSNARRTPTLWTRWKQRAIEMVRGWEAADTHRLNQSHWAKAHGRNINEDIAQDRETLVARSIHEVQNNGFAEGVINTHIADIVGSDGPRLQVHSDSDHFDNQMEAAWKSWWSSPDYLGEDAGVDMLQLAVRTLWTCGEFLWQTVYDSELSPRDVQLRVHQLHPRQLSTPLGVSSGLSSILEGIERNKKGKKVAYYLSDYAADQGIVPDPFSVSRVSASEIIHVYKKLEPGQIRGVPWFAPSLQAIADIRDYDQEVLDIARAATRLGVYLFSDHDDAPFLEIDSVQEMDRSAIRTLPPGWKPEMVKPDQPQTQYVDYRAERQREVGRAVNMPLMKIRLDSSRHNYSSARFDGQGYNRGNESIQKWLSRKSLTPLFHLLLQEMQLLRQIRRPSGVITLSWVWPTAPHVDPNKEANAWKTLLEAGVVSEFEVCAAMGLDYETIVQEQKRAEELRASAGIAKPEQSAEGSLRQFVLRAVQEYLERVRDEEPVSNQFEMSV